MTSINLPSKKILTLEAARAIGDVALAEATKRGLKKLVVVVTDDAGRLIFLARQDEAEPAAIEIGIAKARSAAIFQKPTKEWKERLLSGATWVLAMPNLTPVEGGLPILVDGMIVGGVGIAGASGVLDTEIGTAAVRALA